MTGSAAPLVAVTGATGRVGGRVAACLAQRGVSQRLVVRDPARAPELRGTDVARAAYGDAVAMRDALDGITTLFLVSGHPPDRVPEHAAAIDAARLAGVERIVYLSFLGAAADATFTLAREHHATEQLLARSGLAWTALRPGFYLDAVPGWCSTDGVIAGPAGTGRIAWVSRDDIADVAARVLTEPGPFPPTLDLTGPTALTLAESAAHLAAATGRPIVYRDETGPEARASRAAPGRPTWQIEAWVSSYEAIASGELSSVSDVVERVTGHLPEALPDFLVRHPETWGHLVPHEPAAEE